MQGDDKAAFANSLLTVVDALSVLRKHAKTEELVEAVPEAIKNMLLVLCASGCVNREDKLWGQMWGKCGAVDSYLNPEALCLVEPKSPATEASAYKTKRHAPL